VDSFVDDRAAIVSLHLRAVGKPSTPCACIHEFRSVSNARYAVFSFALGVCIFTVIGNCSARTDCERKQKRT
jgi:hypothetical protein